MIVTVDDVVVWDGEGEQLGLPSLVGRRLTGISVVGETVVSDPLAEQLGLPPIEKVPPRPELKELFGEDYQSGDKRRFAAEAHEVAPLKVVKSEGELPLNPDGTVNEHCL